MVPPWAPPVPVEEPIADPTAPDQPPPPAVAPAPTVAPPLAPPRRFKGARRDLGSFAQGGRSSELRRGLGHYVRSGYGGAATTTRRFGGTVAGGGALYDALTSLGGTGPAAPGLDPAVLRGQSAEQIMDAVVE